MIQVGDPAPEFNAPLADGDIVPFTLSKRLGNAPIVLAFFPGAFTSVCTTEMCAFEKRLSVFQETGATVYGVSVDTPFSLNAWREKEGLSFGLISDHEKTIIDDYGVRDDFEDIGYFGLAKRAVFVVDDDRTITYRWLAKHPGQEPDYETVENATWAAAQ